MSDQPRVGTCQRCGSGFLFTATYGHLLARRGHYVIAPVLCPTCYLAEGPLPKRRGEVKWFNHHKRYGFILTDDGEEVFFHQSQLVGANGGQVREGVTVRFHLHYPAKGPEALNVELCDEQRH
jgi:CspA family cold shock protein